MEERNQYLACEAKKLLLGLKQDFERMTNNFVTFPVFLYHYIRIES